MKRITTHPQRRARRHRALERRRSDVERYKAGNFENAASHVDPAISLARATEDVERLEAKL